MQEDNQQVYFDTEIPEQEHKEISKSNQQEQVVDVSPHEQLNKLIESGNVEEMRQFISRIYPSNDVVNYKDTMQQTCLYKIVQYKDPSKAYEMAKIVIEAGLNPSSQDIHGQSALFYISRDGRIDIMNLLFKHNVSPNQQDGYNQTPLFYACREGQTESCENLIKNQADVNHKDKGHQTPLFYAAREGRLEICKLLVSKGARVNDQDSRKQTPIKVALKNNHKEVVDYLISVGAQQQQTAPKKEKKTTPIKKLSDTKQESMISFRLTYTDNKLNQHDIDAHEFKDFSQNNPELAYLLQNKDASQLLLQYQDQIEQHSWNNAAMKLMNTLWKGNQAYFFHEAVDPIKLELPTYYEVVKKPMDFSTIKKKIQGRVYENPQEFLNDLWLVFDNCILFNGDESFIGKIANGLKTQAHQVIEVQNFNHYIKTSKQAEDLKQEIFGKIRQMMIVNEDDQNNVQKELNYFEEEKQQEDQHKQEEENNSQQIKFVHDKQEQQEENKQSKQEIQNFENSQQQIEQQDDNNLIPQEKYSIHQDKNNLSQEQKEESQKQDLQNKEENKDDLNFSQQSDLSKNDFEQQQYFRYFNFILLIKLFNYKNLPLQILINQHMTNDKRLYNNQTPCINLILAFNFMNLSQQYNY